ncbi:fructose bisphosphate aldolase [Candidatus Corynebacterium faecigallinarum]|uniref:fructose bisphosphate aldolase n=1 Tax=Candidatus Corynebacterium faecigallinarum TaxID=2838528 RepID=UPI003FD6BD6E
MTDLAQLTRFETANGFVAALDQSGGSTPKALTEYGIDESQYSGETEMLDLIHAARTRVLTSPVFTSDRVLAAILFQGTLDREIHGRPVADYLWDVKGILPFVKIDQGLESERDGVQPMREIVGLDDLLVSAARRGVVGTKERSVIHAANPVGIELLVTQQMRIAEHVTAAGLLPILEPEIDIHAPDKAEAEDLLKSELLRQLDGLAGTGKVAVKVSLPAIDGFYDHLIAHPRVARIVALSGGYSRDEANAHLARNLGVIASFSRALLDGLTAQQSDEEFNRTLDASIESIYQASTT